MEIYVDDETKLTLHGLQQYYIKLAETEKNRKLNDLLDLLDFNQVGCGTVIIGPCAAFPGLIRVPRNFGLVSRNVRWPCFM